ncbi:MAG: flagellar M-ring protein FliF [Pisciglobus halotolerans]|nr:flagellar M-ring protein FliF [Pisciglobus halotolerans]
MDSFKNTWTNIQSGWTGLDKKKKTLLILILLLVVGAVVSFTYYTKKVNYGVLFSDLAEDDAGTIVEDLETQKVDYLLEDNGTTILIDKEKIDKYRIQLAVDDKLPETATGFEIFDETSMMATDEDRKIMYQRAISGELERSIGTLDGVKTAKVMLSIPEESVFVTEANATKPTASVVLGTTGSGVSSAAVQGIASLVVGAVDNLEMENIQIVDTKGSLLSSSLNQNRTDSVGLTNQYQQVTIEYEEQMKQKLLQTLAPMFGVENITVAVHAEMNFDSAEEEEVTYGEEHVRSESVQAAGAGTGIENGDNDKLSVVVEDGEGDETTSYDRTVNNELDTKTKKTVRAPGTVEEMTASIVVDAGLSSEDEYKIRDITAAALGIENSDRTIAVSEVSTLSTGDEEPEEPIIEQANGFKTFITTFWPLLIGAVVILVLVMFLIRKLRKTNDLDDEFLDSYAAEEERNQYEAAGNSSDSGRKEADLKEELNQAMSEKESKVKQMAKENPEAAADMIKIWLKDK